MDWFYKLVSQNRLPESWDELKQVSIEKRSGSSVEQIDKFTTERWPAYVKRLSETAEHKGLGDDLLIRKLRKEKSPI